MTGTSTGGAPLLQARQLNAGHQGIPAVRDLDLVLHPGEVVALLGGNGAGKTTTLLTLAGELSPLSGEVLMDGVPTSSSLPWRARRGLAFIPEERSVFMGLTGRQNLRLGRGGVDAALELFPELRPHLGKRAGLLSGGQQQMLTLARALASRPRILLVDELSLGLAPLLVRRLFDVIRGAAHDGVGVILVEQHVRQALEIADRAYVLRHGHLTAAGTAAEVRDKAAELKDLYLASASSSSAGSATTPARQQAR